MLLEFWLFDRCFRGRKNKYTIEQPKFLNISTKRGGRGERNRDIDFPRTWLQDQSRSNTRLFLDWWNNSFELRSCTRTSITCDASNTSIVLTSHPAFSIHHRRFSCCSTKWTDKRIPPFYCRDYDVNSL